MLLDLIQFTIHHLEALEAERTNDHSLLFLNIDQAMLVQYSCVSISISLSLFRDQTANGLKGRITGTAVAEMEKGDQAAAQLGIPNT